MTKTRLAGRHCSRRAAGSGLLAAAAAIFLLAAIPGLGSAQTTSPCDNTNVVPANTEQSNYDDLRADCEALWAFYSRLTNRGPLDDPGPSQWGASNYIGNWEGVAAGRSGDNPVRVFELSLNQFLDSIQGNPLISGPISNKLDKLTGLQKLEIVATNLSGRIPTTIGNLTNLTELNLYRNNLSGSIPSSIGELTKLTRLDLYRNSLSGRIPTTIGNLTELRYLGLDNNNFTGSIPTTIGNLTKLTYLDLSRNIGVRGSIPTSIGNLTQLTDLYLSYMNLSGSLPASMSGLTNLNYLHLQYNRLRMGVQEGQTPAILSALEAGGTRVFFSNNVFLAPPPPPPPPTEPPTAGDEGDEGDGEGDGDNGGGGDGDDQGDGDDSGEEGDGEDGDDNQGDGDDSGEEGDGEDGDDNQGDSEDSDEEGDGEDGDDNQGDGDDSDDQGDGEDGSDGPVTNVDAGDGNEPGVIVIGPGGERIAVSGRPGPLPDPEPAQADEDGGTSGGDDEEEGEPGGDGGEPVGRFADDDRSVHQANIEVIADRGITVGCDPTHLDRFCPNREITRAQMMAFLARALGEEGDSGAESSFSDVADDAWYLPYLARLAELGVAQADPDGSFRPQDPLTRADMAVFLTRAFGHITEVAEPAGVFDDVPADASYAGEVEATFNAGVTRGCSSDPLRYCPLNTVTRAQMASFLARALENTP